MPFHPVCTIYFAILALSYRVSLQPTHSNVIYKVCIMNFQSLRSPGAGSDAPPKDKHLQGRTWGPPLGPSTSRTFQLNCSDCQASTAYTG